MTDLLSWAVLSVVLFAMLWIVILASESLNAWNRKLWLFTGESSDRAAVSCGAVYYAVQGGANFWVCGWNPKLVTVQVKATETVLSCGAVYYTVQDDSNFWVCGWNPNVWPFKWKLLNSTFLWCCLLCCTRWFYLLTVWMKSWTVTTQIRKLREQCFPGWLPKVPYW